MSLWITGILTVLNAGGGVYALSQDSWLAAGGLHLLSGLAGILFARWIARRRSDVDAFEFSVAFGIPLLGGTLCLLHALSTRNHRSSRVAENFTHYIDAHERLGEDFSLHDENTFRPDPGHLAPMADILNSDAPLSEKRLAIEGLAQLETPGAVAILRKALTAESTEVRFCAASVLANIEENLTQRLMQLEEEASRTEVSDDPSLALDLAQTYYDHAYYGLVKGERRTHYLHQALQSTRSYLAATNDPGETLLLTGRIHLALKAPASAERTFDRYLRSHPDDPRALLWRAEARFDQGRYLHTTRDCQAIVRSGPVPARMRNAIELWAKIPETGAPA